MNHLHPQIGGISRDLLQTETLLCGVCGGPMLGLIPTSRVTCNNQAIAFHILSFNKIYSFLLLVNTDTLIPKLIIGVDKNIDTLG